MAQPVAKINMDSPWCCCQQQPRHGHHDVTPLTSSASNYWKLPLPLHHHIRRRRHQPLAISIHIGNSNNAIRKIRRPSNNRSSGHRRLLSIGYDMKSSLGQPPSPYLAYHQGRLPPPPSSTSVNIPRKSPTRMIGYTTQSRPTDTIINVKRFLVRLFSCLL